MNFMRKNSGLQTKDQRSSSFSPLYDMPFVPASQKEQAQADEIARLRIEVANLKRELILNTTKEPL